MTTVRARIIEVEREHARPGGIAPIAAAQRKRRFIPDDIHFFHVSRRSLGELLPKLLTASMRFLFFADLLSRHGDESLLSLCSETRPLSPEYLAMREKRRGNLHCECSTRAGCSVSARTRPPRLHPRNCRRAKEAPIRPRCFVIFVASSGICNTNSSRSVPSNIYVPSSVFLRYNLHNDKSLRLP